MEQVVLLNIISDDTAHTIRSDFRIRGVLQDSLLVISAACALCSFRSSSVACKQPILVKIFLPNSTVMEFFSLSLSYLCLEWGALICCHVWVLQFHRGYGKHQKNPHFCPRFSPRRWAVAQITAMFTPEWQQCSQGDRGPPYFLVHSTVMVWMLGSVSFNRLQRLIPFFSAAGCISVMDHSLLPPQTMLHMMSFKARSSWNIPAVITSRLWKGGRAAHVAIKMFCQPPCKYSWQEVAFR